VKPARNTVKEKNNPSSAPYLGYYGGPKDTLPGKKRRRRKTKAASEFQIKRKAHMRSVAVL